MCFTELTNFYRVTKWAWHSIRVCPVHRFDIVAVTLSHRLREAANMRLLRAKYRRM